MQPTAVQKSQPRVIPSVLVPALRDVKRALRTIYGTRLSGIYLYGSYARGDYDADSDVDLLVTLRDEANPWTESSRLSETLSDICLTHDLLIAVYTVPEVWLRERETPLFINIRREGVLV